MCHMCTSSKGFVWTREDKERTCVEELDAYDPYWDALQVGYHYDEHEARPIIFGTVDGARELARVVQPVWACGLAGLVVHGVRGASRLLDVMFPARWQLDTALAYKREKLRLYLSREPLIVASKSCAADTDIQIMGDSPEASVV